jgi:hypothetical protein
MSLSVRVATVLLLPGLLASTGCQTVRERAGRAVAEMPSVHPSASMTAPTEPASYDPAQFAGAALPVTSTADAAAEYTAQLLAAERAQLAATQPPPPSPYTPTSTAPAVHQDELISDQTGAGEILPVAGPQQGYLSYATTQDFEVLKLQQTRQAEVQNKSTIALAESIAQLNRQVEQQHRDLVRLAEELNKRQARDEKLIAEILATLDQLARQPAPAGGASP